MSQPVNAILACAECGTVSEDEADGWRAYTAGGLDGRGRPVVAFCAEYAEGELG